MPPTKSGAAGSDVTWTVEAQGGVTPYTYEWSWKGSTGGYVVIDPAVNPSAATASLTNHAITSASAGTYKCKVTDAASTFITSVESVLTVS